MIAVPLDWNDVLLQAQALVRQHTKVNVKDDPDQPVSAEGQRKELSVLRPTAQNDCPVGLHETKRFDC